MFDKALNQATPTESTASRVALETNIINAIMSVLRSDGSTANKVYLRIRPSGTADITEETSFCCSADEYNKCVPHALSLEIPRYERDYSGLSDNEIEDCWDNAHETAQNLLTIWQHDITRWIEAGNLTEVWNG